jgi:hypothetical protein
MRSNNHDRSGQPAAADRRRARPFLAVAAAALVLGSSVPGRGDAPRCRYVISNGNVYDTKTRLTWRQGPIPAADTWAASGSFCATMSAEGGGWRLPTVKELTTIVDHTRHDPAIDPQAFPGTPGENFWSSTPLRDLTDTVWQVAFFEGGLFMNGTSASTKARVRCVR